VRFQLVLLESGDIDVPATAEVVALSVPSEVFVVASCDMCSFVFTHCFHSKVVEVSMGKYVLKSEGVGLTISQQCRNGGISGLS
jgi:hypothetical protein